MMQSTLVFTTSDFGEALTNFRHSADCAHPKCGVRLLLTETGWVHIHADETPAYIDHQAVPTVEVICQLCRNDYAVAQGPSEGSPNSCEDCKGRYWHDEYNYSKPKGQNQ